MPHYVNKLSKEHLTEEEQKAFNRLHLLEVMREGMRGIDNTEIRE